MTYYILPTNLNEQGEVVSLRFVEDGKNELVVDGAYNRERIKFAKKLALPKEISTIIVSNNRTLIEIPQFPSRSIKKIVIKDCWQVERLLTLPTLLETLELRRLYSLTTLPDLSQTQIIELNLSSCKELATLPAFPATLAKLDLRGCEKLTTIPDLSRTQITGLNLSSCKELATLPALPPTLAKLDLRGCEKLTTLPDLSQTQIIELNLSYCEALTTLPDLSGTQIEELLLSGCKELATLPAFPATLAKLDLSGCEKLTTIPDLSQTQIIELNLSSCKELATLPALPATLAKLDLSGCEKLTTIPDLSQTQITELNLFGCEALTTIVALPPTLAELNLRGRGKLTTIPDLSQTQITELDLFGCEELTTIVALPPTLAKINLRGRGKLTTIPDLSQTQITELNLSGCQNITALPAFPMTLKSLDLRGCVNLRPTPELIAKLRDLENQNLAQGGCTVIYPAGFFRDSLISENQAKLQEAIAQFNQVNPEFPRPTAILTLFDRFTSEGGQRVQGEEAIRQVVATISDAVNFIAKNPQSLSWIEEIASLYAREGCVNQPVAGWMEISALASISSGQTVLDKLNTARHLLSLDAVKVFYSKHCQEVLEPIKQGLLEVQPQRYQDDQGLLEDDTRRQAQAQRLLPGAGIEVEFGNVLMREVHKMLLQNGDIAKRWPGIPETIYAEGIISSFLTPEIIKQAYDYVKAQIFGKSEEELAKMIISSQHLQAWGDIALKEEVASFKEKQRQNIFTEKQFIAIILGGDYEGVKEKPEDYFDDNLFAIYKAKTPFRERSDDGVSNEIWQAIVQDFVEYKAKKEIEFAQIQQPNPPQIFTEFLEVRLRQIDASETQEFAEHIEKTTFEAISYEKEKPKFLASHKEKSQQLLELIKEFDKNKLKKVPPTLGSKVAAEVSKNQETAFASRRKLPQLPARSSSTASAFPSARPQAASDSTSASDSTRPRRKLPQIPVRSSSTASAFPSARPQAAVQNPRNAENLNQERYQEK